MKPLDCAGMTKKEDEGRMRSKPTRNRFNLAAARIEQPTRGRGEHQATYSLRLPRSLKAEVERLAKQDRISINQFIATAVAEKLAAMRTAELFAERRERADFAAFERLMRRRGGQPPPPDDEIT